MHPRTSSVCLAALLGLTSLAFPACGGGASDDIGHSAAALAALDASPSVSPSTGVRRMDRTGASMIRSSTVLVGSMAKGLPANPNP
jgi:hypothetical protein